MSEELEMVMDLLADEITDLDISHATDAELVSFHWQCARWAGSAAAELTARAKAREAQASLFPPIAMGVL